MTYTVEWKATIGGREYGAAINVEDDVDPYDVGDMLGAQIGETLCGLTGWEDRTQRILREARDRGMEV